METEKVIVLFECFDFLIKPEENIQDVLDNLLFGDRTISINNVNLIKGFEIVGCETHRSIHNEKTIITR